MKQTGFNYHRDAHLNSISDCSKTLFPISFQARWSRTGGECPGNLSLSRNHNFQLVCCRIAFRCICFYVSILHNDSICFQCRSQLNMLSWVRFSSAWILIECRFVQLPSITPSDRKRNDSRRKFCTTLQILTPLTIEKFLEMEIPNWRDDNEMENSHPDLFRNLILLILRNCFCKAFKSLMTS